MTRDDLPNLLYNAIQALGGKATIVETSKYIWENFSEELKNSGDLFYTWQYSIRWAAIELRKEKRLKSVENSKRGIWEIS